jgi:hypothetical protein
MRSQTQPVNVLHLLGSAAVCCAAFRRILVGPLAKAALERMGFDQVFLAAFAVASEDGICEADHARTWLKELMPDGGVARRSCSRSRRHCWWEHRAQ